MQIQFPLDIARMYEARNAQ